MDRVYELEMYRLAKIVINIHLMQFSWKHQCPIEIAKAFTMERFFNKYMPRTWQRLP